jgi:type I restriction enzyme S subunit
MSATAAASSNDQPESSIGGPALGGHLVLDNLEAFCDATGGIQAMRRLVLELAIQGRLTDRSVNDEPAHVLLERLQRERASERGNRSNPPISDNVPFKLPSSWAWARLEQLWKSITDGDHQPPPKCETGIAFLTIGNVSRGTIDFASTRFVGKDYFEGLDPSRVPKRGDLLYTIVGSFGIPVTVDVETPFCVQRHIAILKPLPSTNVPYLRLLMKSDFVYAQAVAGATGIAQPTVGLGVLRNFLVPVPPVEEQERIVVRVESLMRTLDALEAKLTARRHVQTRLRAATLNDLISAVDSASFDVAWQRMRDSFAEQFDSLASVADLRGAILSLAVLGKLAPASSDAPAAVAAGDMYASEFSIPSHWRWAPLGSLCRFIDYRGRTPKKTKAGIPLITAKNVRMGFLRDEPREFIAANEYDAWMTRGVPQCGDVLFTTEAPLGNVAQLMTSQKVALAQRIITLRPIEGLEAAFLKFALMSPLLQGSIRRRATGTTAQGIKASKLKQIACPLPPPQEQRDIVRRVERLLDMCKALETTLAKTGEIAAAAVDSVVREAAVQGALDRRNV